MRRSNAKPQVFDPKPMDPPKLHSRPPPRRLQNLVLVSAASVVAVVLYFSFLINYAGPAPDLLNFGIVIDGGSTGTRIHVFAYESGTGSALPVVDFALSASMKAGPGLSSYAEDPEAAGGSLAELIEFAKGKVPRERWGETEVRLMATAGMRLVGDGERERILESCRKVLRSSGFRFEDGWASVITGSDEGIYAWVAANYALGTLGDDPLKTSGIFELGGASAQVTFVSSEPLPPEFSHVLKFGEITYNIYSHSFLHLGQNVAHESLRELLSSNDLKTSARFIHEGGYKDPCIPKGYLHDMEALKLSSAGTFSSKMEYHPVAQAVGNFSECRSAAKMLLQKEKDKCLYTRCLLGSTFIPKLKGRFIATENFFYTSKFFGLDSTSYLSDLILAGEEFCEEDWRKLKKKYPALEEEELLRYCFSSAYIVALLHDSLGIGINDRRIEFANQVGGIPLDWALGAFIIQKMANQNSESSNWVSAIFFDDSSAYLSLSVVSVAILFTAWSVSKWRKPQLKTIYDLERGRYIMTRIKR